MDDRSFPFLVTEKTGETQAVAKIFTEFFGLGVNLPK